MPTFRAESKIPVLTGNEQLDLQELRNAFYLLEEELRYLFNNLDSENFGRGFSDSLKKIIGDSTKELDLQVDADGLLLALTESSSYRELKNTVSVTADGLKGAIEDIKTLDDMVSEYYTEYTATAEGLTLRVGQNEDGLTALGKTVSENYTEIKQEVDDLSFSVVNANGEETTLRLSDGRLDLSLMGEDIRAAQNTADEAAKTATNYLEYTIDGLVVGNKQSGAWSGYRTRMTASTFEILDDYGNILASYGANTIYLGKNSQNTKIDFCDGLLTLGYDVDRDSALFAAKNIDILSSSGISSIGTSVKDADGTSHGGSFSSTPNGAGIIASIGDGIAVDTYSQLFMNADGNGYWQSTGSIKLEAPAINMNGSVTADSSITIDPGSTSYVPFISKRTISSATYQADFGVGNPATGVSSAQIRLLNSSGTVLNNLQLTSDGLDIGFGKISAPDEFYVYSANSANANRYFTARNDSYNISFGIGSGNTNRGIYDTTRNHWTLYNDANDTYINSPRYIFFNPYSNNGYGFLAFATASSKPAFYPWTNDNGYVGISTKRFTTFYSVNAVNVSSDRRLKKDISYDLEAAEKVFDGLRPAQYRYNNTNDEDLHFGFIAQDVVEALHLGDYDVNNMAMVSKDEYLGMTYQELDAIIVYKIKKLEQRITELEKLVS